MNPRDPALDGELDAPRSTQSLPSQAHGPGGRIEVVCGSMFSGKTEELIRRVKRALYGRQKVQAFKPRIDDRYDPTQIVSHGAIAIEAVPVANSESLMRRVEDGTQVVAIDEAQFFDRGIVEVCNELANQGRRVILAGLDQDYLGRPFPPMPRSIFAPNSGPSWPKTASTATAPPTRTPAENSWSPKAASAWTEPPSSSRAAPKATP